MGCKPTAKQLRARRKFAAMARARAKASRSRKTIRRKRKTTMAKRVTRKRTTKRRAPARRRATTKRRRRASSGGGGAHRGLRLVRHDAPNLLIAGAYGYLESKAKADANYWLNKVPRPIDSVGYTGNIALMAYGATLLHPSRWLQRFATVTATIAAYKLGKAGEMYKGSGTDTIGDAGGYETHGDEHIIDDHIMGALDAEGSMSGVPYDDAVEHASEHV